MHDRFDQLQPYPFEKLGQLLATVTPNPELPIIRLSIGEPKHPAPAFVGAALVAQLNQLEVYPTTGGTLAFKTAVAGWLEQRFHLPKIDPAAHILPVTGTREALFAFVQTVFNRTEAEAKPYVLMPNPFYQIYEGATLLAGGTPYLLPCLAEHGFNPDVRALPDSLWAQTQLVFLCNPGNPTGAVMPLADQVYVLDKAAEFGFVVASDECYSEIYTQPQHPPIGLLEACLARGDVDYARVMVFHSLSKRSNLPGLRSGFVAGDAALIRAFLQYRTYQGGAMSLPIQHASALAWQDEHHVATNRAAYREKFRQFLDIVEGQLEVQAPDAGFYLWAATPISDTEFTQRLYAEQAVTVLPGSYVARTVDGVNPGTNRVRMALVAPLQDCIAAAHRVRTFCATL